jgi:hypothetical protein
MARRVSSWPYVRIHDLGLRRSITGRLLGYGTVVIEATIPDSGPVVLERIPDPNGFYRDMNGGPDGGPASGHGRG